VLKMKSKKLITSMLTSVYRADRVIGPILTGQ
jgi:hypothetical protein